MKFNKAFIAATMITVSCSQMQAMQLESAIDTFIKINQKEPALLKMHRYI